MSVFDSSGTAKATIALMSSWADATRQKQYR